MDRASWILIHGSVLGTLVLLGFVLGLVGLIRLWPKKLSAAAVGGRVRMLKVAVVTMAVTLWGTVLTGTWILYPWYREAMPQSPRSILLANPATEQLHHFGMEWKEHVGLGQPHPGDGRGLHRHLLRSRSHSAQPGAQDGTSAVLAGLLFAMVAAC